MKAGRQEGRKAEGSPTRPVFLVCLVHLVFLVHLVWLTTGCWLLPTVYRLRSPFLQFPLVALILLIVNPNQEGIYERAEDGEVDTRCEKPYEDYSGDIPPQASYGCPKCAPCFEQLPEIHVGSTDYLCETYYSISCTDHDQTPCQDSGSYGTQAALLMDVYDDINAFYNDGTANGARFDFVHKPLGTIAKCFFDYAKAENPFIINSHIGQFLDTLISFPADCGAPKTQVDQLRDFFGAP